MKIVDANVLLYAVNSDVPQHRAAREWLDEALSGEETVGFSWIVLLAFLRISTHPGIFPRPLSQDTAFDTVEAWLSQPGAVLVEPTTRHAGVLRGLLGKAGTAGNLVNDAHLAATAAQHGAEVVSFDADFTRFDGVRVHKLG
ncbi:VapC toxin family PIN domain ribonuclease [Prauserella sp. PE36]|uniref:type II toxin-antitoxin system VapC family toxin n=1 Tax=Prauserella sp. PE36 TaxID=1504709 RepID=UPI000DE27D52|nr:type II toxin-antitoxin system VapC family toxin [Prauserella sp. PE36]RBM16431.1 VapC toxin family PIN domain ribonuclease [Prauserella sp. PE36]